MMAKEDTITNCANCGRGEESSFDLKACTACKLVKYCNRECQIAHRPLHKKACKKRAAEIHDEALFKVPPPHEECPICFLPLPLDAAQTTFQPCCGKVICAGCIFAMAEEARGRGKIGLCAFCRTPNPTTEEDEVKRIKNLVEVDHAMAFYVLAGYYDSGIMGMQQDWSKARELWLRAGELGCHEGYYNLGVAYKNGRGVEVDKMKARHYWELAAMSGNIAARHFLGSMEVRADNLHRAMKHYILSATAGHEESLDRVKKGFIHGIVTKDEYANTLRAYQERHDEMKSEDRDNVIAELP